jgi:hypothetical protein
MNRVNFIERCGWLVALSMCVALQLAHAGDRKDSAVPGPRSSDARFSDFATTNTPSSSSSSSSSPRHGAVTAFFVTNSDSKFARLRRSAEKESAPDKERKKIILFRLDPKFGDISVQPVVGAVKGAQVVVGF